MNGPAVPGTSIVHRQSSATVEPLRPCANHSPIESSSCHQSGGDLPSLQSNFEMLFNLAPIGYLILYEDMAIREVNHTAESLLGISRQELLGNPLILYAPVPFRESLRIHFRRVFSGHEESIELRFDHPGGSVPVQLHSARIPQTTTHRPCCLCSLIDLSGRQNTQDELIRHQARLKALQIEQAKRVAELQDRLLEESTIRRKAQQEARLHSQTVQERSEELDRLRRDLAEQATKQLQTEQHLTRLQQHLSRLTQGFVKPDIGPTQSGSSESPISEELPSPEHLHQIHHRLLSRIEKLDEGVRRRQAAMEPKIRLVLRLLAQADRLRRLRTENPERTSRQSLDQSLQTNETLLQKTCRLNSLAAWQYDPVREQWIVGIGRVMLMGNCKEGFESDPTIFYDSVIPEDRSLLRRILQSTPSNPRIQIVDLRLARENGTIRHIRHTLEILPQPDNTIRISAVVVDITAWKKSEFCKTRLLHRIGRLGRDQIDILSTQRDQLLLEQSSLQTQIEDLSRQRHVLGNRIETLQKGLASLRQQYANERERNRQLVSQFRKHKERLTRLVGERTRQIEDIRRSVETRIRNQRACIADLTVQLDESRSLAEQHLRRYEQLQQRAIQQQQSAQLQLVNDRESYTSRIRELTDALVAAQQNAEMQRRNAIEFQSEFHEQRESLQSALVDAEEKAVRLGDNLQQLTSRYNTLAIQASEEIERLKTELAHSRCERLASQSEYKRDIDDVQTARDNAISEIQRIQSALDLSHQTIADLQKQLQSQQDQSQSLSQSLQSELENLRYRLGESLRDLAGFAQMIRGDIQQILSHIQQGTNHSEWSDLASHIAELGDIADLLIVTRQLGNRTNVDVQSVVESVLDSFQNWIQQAGVQIEIGPLPECHADAHLLARLFYELIDNALKFLVPRRPGRIIITSRTGEGKWFFHIQDNGIGMHSDQIDQAFDLGVQLTPRTPGRGLGLAIVRRIVNLHNGHLEVQSQPGNGTGILVALPLD
ncbi:MAG: PAS domain S-box protein [Phycisphaerae bacterium]|nr:PAS domain S-box protein [Phycisphaerae bacterium]